MSELEGTEPLPAEPRTPGRQLRLAWLSDLHLNVVAQQRVKRLCGEVAPQADVVLLTGDVAEGPTALYWLPFLADELRRPLFFVLGNHEFFLGSASQVRREIRALCDIHERLRWLDDLGVVRLTETAGLVGAGGWADGGYGDFEHSTEHEHLPDYRLIDDLVDKSRQDQLQIMRSWAAAVTHGHSHRGRALGRRGGGI